MSSEPIQIRPREPRFVRGQKVHVVLSNDPQPYREGVILGLCNRIISGGVRWNVKVDVDGVLGEYAIKDHLIEAVPDEAPRPASLWKVGDRVRILTGRRAGEVGSVKECYPHIGRTVVTFPYGEDCTCLDGWLEDMPEPASRPEPTIADTLAGIASWQREAPMDRDVMIHLKGHTVTATASLLAGSTEAFTGKFLSDYTPEAASACMDAIVMQRSRTPIVFGSRDEPPLGDLPYVEDGDPPARDVFFASEEAGS